MVEADMGTHRTAAAVVGTMGVVGTDDMVEGMVDTGADMADTADSILITLLLDVLFAEWSRSRAILMIALMYLLYDTISVRLSRVL